MCSWFGPDAYKWTYSGIGDSDDDIASPDAPDAEIAKLETLGLQPRDLAALSVAEIEEALGAACSSRLLAMRSQAAEELSKLAGKQQTGHIRHLFPVGPPEPRTGKPQKVAKVDRSACSIARCLQLFII